MKDHKSILAVLIIFLAAGPGRGAGLPLYKDPKAAPAARAADLLGRMTVEEKFGQLQQLDGLWEGNYREEHLKLAREGKLGSTLNVRTAPFANKLQKEAVEGSRLGIPVLFAFDVIHGYRTIFPVPLGESAQWDPALAEQAASVAAEEAYSVGLKWTFAPMVDIARDPRWGRIVEGSGEDPYLGSKLAAARVRGFQGADFGAPGKVLACAKHWAGYGAAEAGRDYNNTDISESSLRNIYFPPFKAAADAGAATFMTAFNDLNGLPSTANKRNLAGVLRGEWGFKGFVVSDYTSVKELIAHGLAADDGDAAVKALSAGVDMEMVSALYRETGPAALAAGRLSAADLDASVLRVLEAKFRAGIFEHPYIDPALEAATLKTPEKLRLALAAALKSLVLLKNENALLPLDPKIGKVAVIGALADSRADMLGSWSADGKPADAVTLLEGVKASVSPATEVVFSSGAFAGAADEDLAKAVAAAAGADVIIAAVGETFDMSGEAASRVSLSLPGRQLELLERLKKTGHPVAAVVFNGRPLELGWLQENLPAVLEAWQPGLQGGLAVAQTLFGKANPGGKLPVTFPRSVGQVPIYYAHRNTGRPPNPKEKYSSKYIDSSFEPLYPFGYGLSYSSFAYSGLEVSPPAIKPGGKVRVSFEVKNVSRRAGDEVAQVYIKDEAGSETRPVRELKGFQRLALAPGESRRLTFELGPEELGWHYTGGFAVEPGGFKVYAGSSSVGGLEASFKVEP
ncbi:MAG: glycoside hydrolase family 3 C-terminal domain-containing protein [Elusimicrobia bacterium]|nr:glycoside hydrolase family 3 C-terminal domain-containing protein [Elusimicrobiota bacterium]